jgi:cargo-transport protein YPP1
MDMTVPSFSQLAIIPPLTGQPTHTSKPVNRIFTAILAADEILPEPKFTSLQERRRRTSLLVDVWLFISGLYRRADYYEDAKGAVDEAQLLVEGLENNIMQVEATSKALETREWGDGKSVEELWADVLAEVRSFK